MSPDDDPVQRSEYEQFVKTYEIRHQELRLETKELETDMKGQLNSVINKMDVLSNQMSRRSIDVWKLVASSSVSMIIGYVLNTLQHMYLK